MKQVAAIERDAAVVRAERVTKLGKARADVTAMVEGEVANGFQMKVKAFGDPMAYNLWTLANSLSDKLSVNIIHAGSGTLWTDLEKANLGELGGATLISGEKK